MLRRATLGCGIQWTNGWNVSDLDFADDIAVLANHCQGQQTLVNNITSLAKCQSMPRRQQI